MGGDAGQILLDTDIDAIEAASNLRPAVRIYRNATQSLADNTLVAVDFNSEDLDTHSFHSTSVNPTRITPTVEGWYRCRWTSFIAGATDYSTIRTVMRTNGSTQVAPCAQAGNMPNSVNHSYTTEALVFFNGTTDYIECMVQQDNTANVARNLQSSHPNVPFFEMTYERQSA